jgi:hypothetical protein
MLNQQCHRILAQFGQSRIVTREHDVWMKLEDRGGTEVIDPAFDGFDDGWSFLFSDCDDDLRYNQYTHRSECVCHVEMYLN